ncbi:hypothetical protein SUGI_0125580 [Cryptomeria japonica]|nr:hypothetical protein SUGI_0125580 [Cryptomeria japonica]
MAILRFSKFISVFLLYSVDMCIRNAQATENANAQGLISCLIGGGVKNVTAKSYSAPGAYDSLLNFSLQNLRYAEKSVLKPYAVIVPESREQVQKAVQCCIVNEWQILVRSGGHSYEGLSSTAQDPYFVIIDLMKLDRVDVDMKSKTAWVESGATVGRTLCRHCRQDFAVRFSRRSLSNDRRGWAFQWRWAGITDPEVWSRCRSCDKCPSGGERW